MSKNLITTVIRGINSDRQVILTEGSLLPNGRRIYGVFSDEVSARSVDSDRLAIATVDENRLSLEQIKIAEINSDSL